MKLGILYPLQINELVEKRTVLNHFNYIRTTVKKSNVMPYGDFSVGQDKLSAYIGKSPEVFFKLSNQNNGIQSFNKYNVSVLYLYKFYTINLNIIFLNVFTLCFKRVQLCLVINFQKIHMNHIRQGTKILMEKIIL